MKRRPRSKSFGRYKHRVFIYENVVDGPIYGVIRRKGAKAVELGRDWTVAQRWGHDQAARLVLDQATAADPTPTLQRIADAYWDQVTPHKDRQGQLNDRRCRWLWYEVLGYDFDVRQLTRAQWQDFIARRTSGEIDTHGLAVTDVADRQPVSPGTAKADLQWLRSVLRFATEWKDAYGRRLLSGGNPTAGYPLPSPPDIKRPVATTDRYEHLLKVADQVTTEVRKDKKRVRVRTPFREILMLAAASGRRITSILSLRYSDLRLSDGKHGAIVWPARTDKKRKAWRVPLNAIAREALDRVLAQRPGIGDHPLFPRFTDPTQPVSKELAYSWLREAERLAKLEHLPHGGWHMFRRGWATSRKHLPDVDVMAVGGWSDVASLKTAYQQPDPATMFNVATSAVELREVKA